ncbi:MAG TPA: RND family transporter [Methanophagales archaeon]|nr:RND family transporter [Methanophagales archaeon]
MIEEILSFYANVSKKLYPFIIVLALVIAMVSLQQATKTEISTDFHGFFYPDTPGMIEARIVESDFMGVDTVDIFIEVDRVLARDVLEEDVLTMTAEIVDAVSIVPGVFRVSSVLDLGKSREEIMGKSSAEIAKYVSMERQYSIVTANLDSAEVPDRTQLVETFQKTVAKVDKAKGTEVTVAGSVAVYYAWDQALKKGFASSIIVSALTIIVVLFFVFRSPVTAVFTMVPILVAVLAAFGTMHFINIPMNFFTVMFGSVTLGLGVDYSIHLVHRYHEEVEKGNENALNIAVAKMGRNTIFTSLTTMAAFSAFAVAGLRMVAEYGLMSLIAISFSALSVLLFLPSFLVLESKIGRKTLDISKISNTLGLRGFLPNLMTRLSDFSVKKPMAVIFFLAVALVPVFYGMSQIETMTDNDMWLPQDMPAVKANNIIEDEFGEYYHTMILVLADDIRTPEVMRAMADIEKGVEGVPHVVKVSSIASLLNPMPGEKKDIERNIEALPLDQRRQFVTGDYTEGLMIIKVDGEELKEGKVREIEDVLDYVETPGDAVFLQAGMPVVSSRMESIMEKDQLKTTLVSLVLVLIMLFLALRSFMGIILGLLPVILAIIFAMGTMGLLQIPNTPLTIMIATLLLGLGIDYSIHFMSRYKEERERGEKLENALRITSSTVGESIALTSITTTFGFLSLMTMSLVPVQDFGKIAAIGLIFCMFFVPVIISVGLLFQERVIRRALAFFSWKS